MPIRPQNPGPLRVAAGLLTAAFLLGVAHARAVIDPAGHWEGHVLVPGSPLGVAVDLAHDDAGWHGTIDIPLQGARGLALTDVMAGGDSLRFTIANVPGAPRFQGVLADSAGTDLIRGDFTQGGRTVPFRLGRGRLPAPRRPQHPVPPYPYREEEVGYESGPVHLAGTLTLPAGKGPFPAAVLITGSGAQNRDEELFGHKFFLVLADHLTRAGIAVLRADDRGVGGSTGRNSRATTSDFADDALAGLRYLRGRPEIDPRRIGFVGHSEGGIVGPLAAARAPDEVAFVVMLAGTGVPLDEVLALQVERIERTGGAPEWRVAEEVARARLVCASLRAGADSAAVRFALRELLAVQAAARPDSASAGGVTLDEETDGALRGMLSPWFRFAVRLDPRDALRRVRCPVLALNGSLDLQVDPDQNLPEIERALREGGNTDVTVRRLDGLNHALQTASTGHPSEYAQIEETMSPVALDAIRAWILDRAGRKG